MKAIPLAVYIAGLGVFEGEVTDASVMPALSFAYFANLEVRILFRAVVAVYLP